MAQDNILQKFSGKMINEETLEPVAENGGCYVEFFMEAELDPLLSDGGEIEKRHPKVKEIRKIEQEALALLRTQEPYADPEPQPPAKDAAPAAVREYQQAHKDWDERRLEWDEDLKERATMLRDHPDHKEVFIVTPAGRPIYVDREYIEVRIPGDKDNIPRRPVRKDDISAYRQQYNRWKEGQSQASVGTPLEQWPGVTKSQVKELAYFGIRTVENLAAVNDANLAKIGHYTAARRKAQDWLETARGMAPVEAARAETKRVKEQLDAMQKQMTELLNSRQSQNPQNQQNQQRK